MSAKNPFIILCCFVVIGIAIIVYLNTHTPPEHVSISPPQQRLIPVVHENAQTQIDSRLLEDIQQHAQRIFPSSDSGSLICIDPESLTPKIRLEGMLVETEWEYMSGKKEFKLTSVAPYNILRQDRYPFHIGTTINTKDSTGARRPFPDETWTNWKYVPPKGSALKSQLIDRALKDAMRIFKDPVNPTMYYKGEIIVLSITLKTFMEWAYQNEILTLTRFEPHNMIIPSENITPEGEGWRTDFTMPRVKS